MYLTVEELKTTYYKKAALMQEDEITIFLARANSFTLGVIGGIPPYSANLPAEQLKAAVALAFEYFAAGESGKVNPVNGNVAAIAPASFYSRDTYVSRSATPLDTVKEMLAPYVAAFENSNSTTSDNRVMFL